MKKYVDADKVIKATIEIPRQLRKYDNMMKEKPNFNKSKENKKRDININRQNE